MQGFCEKLDKIFEKQLSVRLAFNVIDLLYEYENIFPWTTYMPTNKERGRFPCNTYEENGVSLKHEYCDRYNKIYITYESGITIIIHQIGELAKFKIKNNDAVLVKTEQFTLYDVTGIYLRNILALKTKSAAKISN